MTAAHICAPRTVLLRRIIDCPTCQRRRRFSGMWAAYYGASWTCCACGDTWTEGERHPRPFSPGWRPLAAAAARRRWDAAPARAEARRQLRTIAEEAYQL